MEKSFTVGDVAEATGLSRKSIRYYEEEKLIPKALRSASGYRLYDEGVLERLKFIQKAKEIGFSLEDIKGILELSDKGKPCCDRVFIWSEKKLRDLDEQMNFLMGLRKKILHYQKKWKGQADDPGMPEPEICQLISGVEIEKSPKNKTKKQTNIK